MSTMSKSTIERFAGRRIYLKLEPTIQPRALKGKFTDALLRFHHGLGFEQFLAKGGSVVRLRNLVRNGAVELV
jgi:hypothetical protein